MSCGASPAMTGSARAEATTASSAWPAPTVSWAPRGATVLRAETAPTSFAAARGAITAPAAVDGTGPGRARDERARGATLSLMLGLGTLRRVIREVRADVAAARDRDPAARGISSLEILGSWAGVQALLAHRVAHALHEADIPLAPHALAYLSRGVTGIEIHPGALIGDEFFIDHGSGVVIGETAEIGDRVTLYQGVTLGGTEIGRGKRHPTLDDDVTVGSGAKLLGPVSVGRNAKVGANTVVIEDVPPETTVVGNPGHPVRVEGRPVEGPDTDWIHLPDPIAEAMQELSARLSVLERRLADATGEASEAADVTE